MNLANIFSSTLTALVVPRREQLRASTGDSTVEGSRIGPSRWPEAAYSAQSVQPPGPPQLDVSVFGPHDPVLDAPRFIWTCPCGQRPALRFRGTLPTADTTNQLGARHGAGGDPSAPIPAHLVRCLSCGRSGKPGSAAWQAITEWNQTYPDLNVSLDRFPFFVLAGLGQREARTKLLGIRSDLEAHRVHAKRQLRDGRDPGRLHRDRLDAYLRWTTVAQALALAHSRISGSAGAAPGAAGAADARNFSMDWQASPLSAGMLHVLLLASEGRSLYADCSGRREHGARLQTVRGLVVRGLLEGSSESITAEGRQALARGAR
jgi:hypothetical protein